MFSLKDKVVVVTGGSGLLGKEFRAALSRMGALPVNADISCDDNPDDLEYRLDITDSTSIVAFIEKVTSRYGDIDGWVNNAYPRTEDWGLIFEDIPAESLQKNVDMHLNGYFICSQKIAEQMKRQGHGSIVNMSSIYGVVGPDFSIYGDSGMTMPAAYSMIKAGIINLTRYMASYYGSANVRVNCISPGGIFDHQDKTFVNNYTKKVPLGRMARPEDISPAVVFLLSDESAYITGQNLFVDGGYTST